jgi:hypothetical protein
MPHFTCSKCQTVKPIAEQKKYRRYCKSCYNLRQREWRSKHREQVKEYNYRWRTKNLKQYAVKILRLLGFSESDITPELIAWKTEQLKAKQSKN